MAERVTWNGSAAEVAAFVRRLPAVLAGKLPDTDGIAYGLQLRLGVALLSKVQQDFLTKSRGGTGEDGIRWRPLERSTVAQRRITASERKAAGVGTKTRRGLLSAAQDKQWRRIFATRRTRLIAGGYSPGSASATAAKMAWAALKAAGAQTRIGLFGNRKVDTLRDTGELFRSFSPGIEDRPSHADGQIFQVASGRVTIGTNKKPWHHRGIPGKLPARPFWPLDGSLPRAWWSYLLGVYQRGLAKLLARYIDRGGR